MDHGKIISIGAPEALINQLKGVSTIKLSSDLPLDMLKTFSYKIDSNYKKNTVTIKTENIIDTLNLLINLIKKHEKSVDELHIKQPNLEDLFLELTGRSLRN
jgi:ABC-2 type transport system ATP-binding protein